MTRREEEEGKEEESADLFLSKRSGGSPGTQECFWCRDPASWCWCALPTHQYPPFMEEHSRDANDPSGGKNSYAGEVNTTASGCQGGMEVVGKRC